MRIVEQHDTLVNHRAKASLFDAMADIAGALGTGRRAEIIDVLAQGERSVEEIAVEIDQSTANASHHLRRLAQAGLVRSRRDGTYIFYRLTNEHVEQLWLSVRLVAKSVRSDLGPLAKAYLGSADDIKILRREDLLEQLALANVTLLDVRPKPEYRAGHIPGAISIPLANLTSQIKDLPEHLTIVAYCRGPYCAFAPAAVRILLEHGLDAARLEDGFPEWRQAGLSIAVGDTVENLTT